MRALAGPNRRCAARRPAAPLTPRTVVLAGLAAAALLALLPALPLAAQLPPPPQPPGNPVTPAKANLGKVLFWDEQLSATRTVACGTCHFPAVGGEDPRSGVSPLAVHPGPDGLFGGADDVFGSPGVPLNGADGLYDLHPDFGLAPQVTNRRTISMINAAYAPELFWDGRAPGEFVDPVTMQTVLANGAALESQVVQPPVSDVEMANVGRVWQDVVDRVGASDPLALSPQRPSALDSYLGGRSYAQLFDEAFGSPGITAPRIAMAIASYERTLFTNQSPFDQYLATNTGLTAQELDGRAVFNGIGGCNNCHQLAIMTDHSFRYTGVRPVGDDPGRMAVTSDPMDEGRMRVPSLRDLELRAPYMHNGRFDTIQEVIDFYDRGGDFNAPNKDPLIHPLGLTPQQKSDLLAFLGRPLTDPRLAAEMPPFDRPTLYSESDRAPVIEGSGQPGSGALTPWAVALEPPLIGNPSFTVAVWNALGGASATLVIDDHDPGFTLPGSGAFAFETLTLDGSGAGNGFGSVSLPIPSDPGLDGDEWFGRWYIDDTGGGFPVAVSELIRFTTFLGGPAPSDIFVDGFESGDTSAWSVTIP